MKMKLTMRDRDNYFGCCDLWDEHEEIEIIGSGKYLSAWMSISYKVDMNENENKIYIDAQYSTEKTEENLNSNLETPNEVSNKCLDGIYPHFLCIFSLNQ